MKVRIRRLPWTQVLLLIVMFVSLGVAASFSLQNASTPRDEGSSYDASDSGYRAWYELLRRESVRVDRFNSLAFDLKKSRVRTLIVSLPRYGDAAFGAQIGDIDKFLESGGGVIVLGGVDQRVTQRFPYLRTTFTGKYQQATIIDGDLRKAGIRFVMLPAQSRFTATRGTRVLIGDGSGAFAILKEVHRGRIIALATSELFRNDQIAGNAQLAYALVALAGGEGVVAFDEQLHGYGLDRPWWMLLPVADRVALVLFALALLVWLFYDAIRLGPAVALEPPPDPTTRAYLTSLATLYGRARADFTVICGSVDAVKHLVSAEPGRLASERARADFSRLVAYASDDDSRNLIPAVRLAVDLRKAIVRHGKRNRARRAAS